MSQGVQPRDLDPTKAIADYIHSVWTSEQGLPQNSVTALCQTCDGYLWIGTLGELVRYNGVRFVAFKRTNAPAQERYIGALLEDADGAVCRWA